MTVARACTVPHRTDPDRPRTALGGLQLCAGHLTALTETLTGPSAADDPTMDTVWGVDVGYCVVVCDSRDQAAATLVVKDRDRRFRMDLGPGSYSAPPVLVCGDGESWHDPRDYRPGQLARAYATLATLLTGHVTVTASAGHVSGTTDWRLPIADHVAELRSQIRHDLAVWARIHSDQLASTPPTATDPVTLSAYLARYTDWAAAQPWVADYVTVLTELRSRAHALVDLPQPRLMDVAACIERPDGVRCEGRLTSRVREEGDTRPVVIECYTCGANYTGERWEALGRRIAADTRRGKQAA